MKRFLSTLLAAIILFSSICLISSCKSKGSDCLVFELNEDGETCTLVGVQNCMETDLVVPEKFKGKKVVSIGDNALPEMLQSVKIPKSISQINEDAFSNCENPIIIYFFGNIDKWIEIGEDVSVCIDTKVVCSDGAIFYSTIGWCTEEVYNKIVSQQR